MWAWLEKLFGTETTQIDGIMGALTFVSDTQEGYAEYSTCTDQFYPEAIKLTLELVGGELPCPAWLESHVRAARELPESAWSLAFLGRDEIVNAAERSLRASALERARLVATAQIKYIVDKPLKLHITPGQKDWRL